MNLTVLIFVGVIVGLVIFCSTREHFLSTLLSLEFMVLMIFLFMFLSLSYGVFYYSLVYLVVTACEGALGLSILVVSGRTHGGDYFKSFSFFRY